MAAAHLLQDDNPQLLISDAAIDLKCYWMTKPGKLSGKYEKFNSDIVEVICSANIVTKNPKVWRRFFFISKT